MASKTGQQKGQHKRRNIKGPDKLPGGARKAFKTEVLKRRPPHTYCKPWKCTKKKYLNEATANGRRNVLIAKNNRNNPGNVDHPDNAILSVYIGHCGFWHVGRDNARRFIRDVQEEDCTDSD